MPYDLSILCVTRAEEEIIHLLDDLSYKAETLNAEFVIVVDSTSDRWVNIDCNVDKFATIKSQGYIESILDEAITYTTGKYILRIDDDESIPDQLLNWLLSKEYLLSDNWKFARCHLYPNIDHYITNPPLYPDHQTRLSIREKSGNRPHIHAGSPFGGGQLCPYPILHHKFIVKSIESRQNIINRYNTVQSGMGTSFAHFSTPELVYKPEEINLLPIFDIKPVHDDDYIDLIINHSLSMGMYQHLGEIKPFYQYLLTKNIKNIVEIGTLKGGTATLFHTLLSQYSPENSKLISIDLPDGRFGSKDFGYNQVNSEARNEQLSSNLSHFTGILGNSHDILTYNKVKSALNGKLVDLLFIDGDHTYEGVEQDFEMYSKLLNKNGIIAFHDILDTPIHRATGCEVNLFWDELKGLYSKDWKFTEFTVNGPWGGIGVIEGIK